MPLFVCTACECVENTALCHYWTLIRAHKPALCSACDPQSGRWHGKFSKEKPTQKDYLDSRGGVGHGWVQPYPRRPETKKPAGPG